MGADKNMWFTEEGEPMSGTPHRGNRPAHRRPAADPDPDPAQQQLERRRKHHREHLRHRGADAPGPRGRQRSKHPQVSNLSLSPSRFRVGPHATAVSAASGVTGTTITYTLSKAAEQLKLQFLQPLPGRRKGSRCVALLRTLRKARRCTRLSSKGTLTRTGQQGTNSVAFSGRIGRKALKPAKYQVAITATDSAGQTSAVQTASFTVLAPKRAKARK